MGWAAETFNTVLPVLDAGWAALISQWPLVVTISTLVTFMGFGLQLWDRRKLTQRPAAAALPETTLPPGPRRIHVMLESAQEAMHERRHALAERRYSSAITACLNSAAYELLPFAYVGAGVAARCQNKFTEAETCLQEGLSRFRAVQSELGIGWALAELGTLAERQSDDGTAERYFTEAHEVLSDAGSPLAIKAEANLAAIMARRGSA